MQHLDEGTLQTWLDRERAGLDPSELAEIESHLNMCDECASRLEALQALDSRAHALLGVGRDVEATTPPFEDVVRHAQGNRQRMRALSRMRSLAWAASVVLAVGVGWMTNDLYRGGLPLSAPTQDFATEELERAEPPLPEAEIAASARGREAAEMEPAEQNAPPSSVAARRSLVADADQGVGNVAAGAPAATDGRADAPPQRAPAAADAVAELRTNEAEQQRAAGADDRAAAPAPEPNPSAPPIGAAVTRSAFADAANVGTVVVSGRVEDDQSGDPLASAQIYVDGLAMGTLSQQDGTFELELPALTGPDATAYEVTVQRIGYRTQRKELAARPGDSVIADFTMPEEALALQEVVVTGTAGGASRSTDAVAPSTLIRLADDAWVPASRARAEEEVGLSLSFVPDLDVLSIEMAVHPGTGAALARIRQRLRDGRTLTLVEEAVAADGAPSGVAPESNGAVESRRIGQLLVTGTALLSNEELRELLGTLR